MMLLPQGLMFYSRTIFLLARPQYGGVGCTLQEIGFAQGTIGVIAFLLGVSMGRSMQYRYGE
jgi:PAT family beta-lactamase induction signal transducer AmpG